MAEYDGISQFLKAAPRRLKDAEELLQPPSLDPRESGADRRHLRAAVYLAGYAVECGLKGYIVDQQSGVQTLTQAMEARRMAGEKLPNILGHKGHHLALLLSMTDLESQLAKDNERAKDWAICLKWKSTWRYDPKPPDPSFATEFVAATRRVYEWLRLHIR